jgi:hypothetical protein
MLVNERVYYQTECLKRLDADEQNPYSYMTGAALKVFKVSSYSSDSN